MRVVVGFSLGWRDVPDRSKQAPVVEPIDPFESCQFDGLQDGLQIAPQPVTADDLGLVMAIDCLAKALS